MELNIFNNQGPYIELLKTENELIQHLKQFCQHLHISRPDLPPYKCHIAGGWVRDKVSGLHNPCAIG
jgi:tRNA nucleotidyltransferase/poly(A) polymerase